MTAGADNSNKLKDSILELMSTVSYETKVEIIAELTKSLKKKSKSHKDVSYFAGKWISDKSESEISEEIRASRSFNRKNIDF